MRMTENTFNLLVKVAVITVVFILLLGFLKGVEQFYERRSLNQEYNRLQKEHEQKIKEFQKQNEIQQDSIAKLKLKNVNLSSTIQNLNKEINTLENEKPKIIYRVASMSISEQQEYFTERYKSSDSRLSDSSESDNRSGIGRPLSGTVIEEDAASEYFGKRYT